MVLGSSVFLLLLLLLLLSLSLFYWSLKCVGSPAPDCLIADRPDPSGSQVVSRRTLIGVPVTQFSSTCSFSLHELA